MNIFKLRRFHALVILQCVRWYSKYAISYRQLEAMMQNAASWSTTRPSGGGFSGWRCSTKGWLEGALGSGTRGGGTSESQEN